MSNTLQQRDYYKIFTGHNQLDGYDNIHLGYEASTTEVTFKKDVLTYFHYPFFSDTVALKDSTLAFSGATSGPIPAMADKIFKNLGGYGENTPWGTPSGLTDGTWLCSWLYAPDINTEPVWLDRYYNPGRIAYEEALQGTANYTDYITYGAPFTDIPTVLTFEAGVLYSYLHVGENTASMLVKTLAGDDNSHLKLEVNNWVNSPIDTSIYNNTIMINPFNVNDVIDKTLTNGSLNLENYDFVDVKVVYNDVINIQREFTVAVDVNHNDWNNASSSQLVGCFTGDGGYGLFYDNLKYFPFFVVPETNFGHLIYFNQNINAYNDIGTNSSVGIVSNPQHVAINGDGELYVVDTFTLNNKKIIKYNHLGDVLSYYQTDSAINTFILSGDNIIVVDQTYTNILDGNLVLKYQDNSVIFTSGTKLTFDYFGNLLQIVCNDIKCDILNQVWTVGMDNNLYYDGTLFAGVSSVQKIAIDPNNDLWVLSDSNTINKINIVNKSITSTFSIGVLNDNPPTKNISFVNVYDRTNNSNSWYAIIVHSGVNDRTVYQVSLDGELIYSNSLISNINPLEFSSQLTKDNKALLSFSFDGDFTGYEWKRIFNNVKYANKPQVHFRIGMNALNGLGQTINSQSYVFKVSVPVDGFEDDVNWHSVAGSFKNNTMKVYIDSFKLSELCISNIYDINPLKKNDLWIGTPNGKADNYNYEVNTRNLIFNGKLNNVRFYDYELPEWFQSIFAREVLVANDLVWDIPTADLQYIEKIDRFFKHKMPGSKSPFYRIKLSGLGITDPNIRALIEQNIQEAVALTKPAYVELLDIEWVD